jgi:hypothetical protein
MLNTRGLRLVIAGGGGMNSNVVVGVREIMDVASMYRSSRRVAEVIT